MEVPAFALVGSLCLGCSFAFVTGPPSESALEAESAPQCTTSVLHPIGDSVNAGLGGLNVAIAASAGRKDVSWYGITMESETALALGAAQLATFGAAAIYGFVQTSRCSSYLAEQETKGPSWSPARSADPAPLQRDPVGAPVAAPLPSATHRASAPAPAPAPAPVPTPAASTAPPAPAPTAASTSPAPASTVPTASFD